MFYLKYRPQTIGQLDNEKIRESLGQALLANKWAHAYLLTGPKGTGKTSTARLIAKVVNCTNRKRGEEPCNRCVSCKAITTGSSLDVMEIDAASNTGVDDIRDLREKAKLSPTGSKYKVYIIDEVHMLSTSAFNALLKILEEPPEHVIFVLATTDSQKLPPTVVSRCLVYDFGQTSKGDVIKKLQKISAEEKIRVNEEILIQIVEMVGTSHRDAQKLLEQVAMESANGKITDLAILTSQTPKEKAKQILQFLEEKNSKEAIDVLNEYVKGDGKIKDLLGGIILELRNILLSKNGVSGQQNNVKILEKDVVWLIERLMLASGQLRDCPVAQLPLEMVIIEFCKKDEVMDTSSETMEKEKDTGDKKLETEVKVDVARQDVVSVASSGKSEPVVDKWPEILAAVKPYNHSLVAFLRASRPTELGRDSLTLEVFYKFHKEKLEEKKNREILEKVISVIMGRDLRVKFVLAEKR